MKTKVCAWCEKEPTANLCTTAQKIHEGKDYKEKDSLGRFVYHLAECEMTVLNSTSKETKDKWNKLKI